MSRVYDHQANESAVAVAAVAFSIKSHEEAALERQRDMRAKEKTRKEDTSKHPQLVPGRVSIKQNQNAGGTRTPTRQQTRQDYRVEQAGSQSNRPVDHHMSSTRPVTTKETGLMYKQKGNASRLKVVGTKENSWERAQTERINKRYENLKSSILAWENEKKVRARIKMERRKSLLEQKITRNQQHFDAKISRIDNISRGASDKARRTKTSGNVPVKCCLCFRM